MKITVLGSGTSQGVPVIGCDCDVCQSNNEKDYRRRCSILIEKGNTNIVIDTGPDFREQMLRAKVKQLDAVLFTHEHKDHVAGLDDIRAFNFMNKGKEMEVYATPRVQKALKREFEYVFAENKYPGVPEIHLNNLGDDIFTVDDITIQPINVMHYKLPVKCFRVDDFAYVTDANFISKEEKKKLIGLDVLILNALRREPHISHFSLEEALDLIRELKPRMAYLTHISHLLGKHDDVEQELPENVRIAYDGLGFST
ncbi:MAG: phosphoribosyl 1,2-cyclic phosphate phosphodiesterase [Vicingaceae bacterium]|jgi:phosphoribosyl 1,2-cyclic phosphate phosphodiesterase